MVFVHDFEAANFCTNSFDARRHLYSCFILSDKPVIATLKRWQVQVWNCNKIEKITMSIFLKIFNLIMHQKSQLCFSLINVRF